ncbi:DUF1559 domain-containing protein [Planctellipticum variicoloris]|nr:DUF1559 domain-containing protein [Planctomycetaceae bacterium SH412]
MALHNYHDTHSIFPYSTMNDGAMTASTTQRNILGSRALNHRGWSLLLPYIDQSPLYNQINFSEPAAAFNTPWTFSTDPFVNGNARAISRSLPAFLCPSDNGDPFFRTASIHYQISTQAQAAGLFGAKTSYDFNVDRYSSSQGFYDELNRLTRRMFGVNNSARIRDITDGTSNTVAVAEGTLDVRNGIANTWGYSKWVGNGIDFGYANGINWWPCCSWAPPMTSIPGRLSDWGTPGSTHTGGAHALMADGSVRFFSENLNRTTQLRLAQISDGNPLGDF